jgi:carbon monoxide dehydrogenase subunit G
VQLENSFTVPVPVDEAWQVLLDIDRIAPCMPGAALDSVDGDDFTGRVKVKLGPINLTYQGKASIIEKDEAAHRAVIDARGKDQRGNGTAAAVVTATLAAEGAITRVHVLTELNITGRPAQFGRAVMMDVGSKLLGQFADKLAARLGEGDAAGAQSPAPERTTPTVSDLAPSVVATAPAATPKVPNAPTAGASARDLPPAVFPSRQQVDPEPIDLLEVAGGAALSRFGMPVAGVVAAVLVLVLVARRRRPGSR